MFGLGVRVAWCSVVVMDLFEVAMVRGRLVLGFASWLMLREDCVWMESWLMLSPSSVVLVVEIAGGRLVGRVDMEG